MTQKARSPRAWQTVCVCALLALAVWGVFGQTAWFGFINYDDNINVYGNPVVAQGLTRNSVGWAFTHEQVLNWIPLTTLSHMLDCEMFGLRAGGHHLVNVLWHAATAVLLFLVLRRMTGSLWRSAFVAAVFAMHPLRAESVAWVSERKDVLSGFFFMLTLWAYLRFAEEFNPPSRRFGAAKVYYLLVAVFFVLGLLSKGMVATLPCVLLLLDYWPLGRFHNFRQFLRVSAEKIPLFALTAASLVGTALVPGMVSSVRPPLLERLSNALVSYVVYMRQMVFPSGLAIPYPSPPHGQPLWQVMVAAVVLVAITALVIACRQQRPYLLMGWLWYVGMLAPVVGIVQLALYAHADRYTYLPGIGLAIAGTWAVADLTADWKYRQEILGTLAAAIIIALIICGHIQTSYWKDNESLWRHTLACTSDNALVHLNLGNDLKEHGKVNEAILQYREALKIEPENVGTLNNLGTVLVAKGAEADALAAYQKALKIQPKFADTHINLGDFYEMHGKLDDAIAQYRQALEIEPENVGVLNNLGNVLGQKGLAAEAIETFQKALQIAPDFTDTHVNLGNVFLGQGKLDEAIGQYREALALAPHNADVLNNLGKALGRQGSDAAAIVEYEKALQIRPDYADVHFNLANRLVKQGRLGEAALHYRRAVEINPHDVDARNKLVQVLQAMGKTNISGLNLPP